MTELQRLIDAGWTCGMIGKTLDRSGPKGAPKGAEYVYYCRLHRLIGNAKYVEALGRHEELDGAIAEACEQAELEWAAHGEKKRAEIRRRAKG